MSKTLLFGIYMTAYVCIHMDVSILLSVPNRTQGIFHIYKSYVLIFNLCSVFICCICCVYMFILCSAKCLVVFCEVLSLCCLVVGMSGP